MAGLLYKDFISIKGKQLTITYMVIFAVIIIMRLLLPLVFLQIEMTMILKWPICSLMVCTGVPECSCFL